MFNLEDYTILVVDDFAQMRSTCRRMLQDFDPKQVDACGSGDEAFELMRNNNYDIVLCDYNLGSGKDGQQVLEEARHEGILEYASIFIMITGENTKAMVMAAVEYEPDAYLTKPFTKEILFNRLQQFAERKQGLGPVGEAIKNKDYPLAIQTCDTLIQQSPKNAIHLLKIKANILFTSGQLDQAEQVYQSIWFLTPTIWNLSNLRQNRTFRCPPGVNLKKQPLFLYCRICFTKGHGLLTTLAIHDKNPS